MTALCVCGNTITGHPDNGRYRYACTCGLTIWAYNDHDATTELAHPLNVGVDDDGHDADTGRAAPSGGQGDE